MALYIYIIHCRPWKVYQPGSKFSDYDDYDGFGFGIYPTGGVDYKFSNIPLNLTADIRPTFLVANPNNHNNGFIGNLGIAARYTF